MILRAAVQSTKIINKRSYSQRLFFNSWMVVILVVLVSAGFPASGVLFVTISLFTCVFFCYVCVRTNKWLIDWLIDNVMPEIIVTLKADRWAPICLTITADWGCGRGGWGGGSWRDVSRRHQQLLKPSADCRLQLVRRWMLVLSVVVVTTCYSPDGGTGNAFASLERPVSVSPSSLSFLSRRYSRPYSPKS